MFLKISQISQEKRKRLKKIETPAQVFSYEIYEIFKNTFLEEHLRTAASVPDVMMFFKWNLLCSNQILADLFLFSKFVFLKFCSF